jgi:hypothetical protein
MVLIFLHVWFVIVVLKKLKAGQRTFEGIVDSFCRFFMKICKFLEFSFEITGTGGGSFF